LSPPSLKAKLGKENIQPEWGPGEKKEEKTGQKDPSGDKNRKKKLWQTEEGTRGLQSPRGSIIPHPGLWLKVLGWKGSYLNRVWGGRVKR